MLYTQHSAWHIGNTQQILIAFVIVTSIFVAKKVEVILSFIFCFEGTS